MKRRLLPLFLLTGLLMAQSTAPPQITLNPSSGVQGATLDVTVNVAIPATATIAFEPAGNLTPSNLRVTGGQSVFTLRISPAATPGPYTLVLTSNSPTVAQLPPVRVANAFTVRAAPAPAPAAPRAISLRSITPSQITAGDPAVSAQISGAGILQGVQLAIPGVNAQVTNVSPNGDAMTVLLSAPANATTGPRNIIATNPDGTNNANQQPPLQLNVLPPRPAATTPPPPPRTVVLRSIVPAQITAGDPPINVQIAGAGIDQGAHLSISGLTVQVNSISAAGDSMTATLTAPASAAPGPRNVIVTNPDGTTNTNQVPAVQINVLPVRAPTPPPVQPPTPPTPPRPVPLPTISSIDPHTLAPGSDTLLRVTGTNFQPGADFSIAGQGAVVLSSGVQTPQSAFIELRVETWAPSGARNVYVTNPGGFSNQQQSPPAQIMIVAPQPTPQPQQPPTPTPQPTQPTTPTPPPPQPTQPTQPTPPPTTTQPPTPTPTPTPPPVTPQPPTPTPTQPPTPPPTTLPPKPKPPTEILKGPRIDVVTPQKLEAGKHYTLNFQGKNLSQDTTISLGKDVHFRTKPFFLSPTSAKVDVDVVAGTPPGTIAAIASNKEGSNKGPGGVLITGPAFATPPAKKTPPIATLPIKYKQPKGTIILDAPCDPDQLKGDCKQPVGLDDETSFVWHESNPGLAKFFIFEIVDGDGKVLFSAQTSKKYFHLSAANLASLPRINIAPASRGGGSSIVAAKPKDAVALAAMPSIKPGDVVALDGAMQKAGPSAVKNGVARAAIAGRQPEVGEVYWRVGGMGNRIDLNTGIKTAEMIQVEDSPERPILLPLPPNGFSCDNGTPGSKLGTLDPLFFPTKYTYSKRPKPCPGNSTNICSVADYAMMPNSARLDLSRVPFNIGQIGDLNGNAEVSFNNVFVDWGDGSEPKPLKVKGTLGSGKQNLKSLRLISPGGDDTKRIRHLYINDDPDAEFVVYKIRIFSLADPDKVPPSNVGKVSKSEVAGFGSLTAKGVGSQSSTASATAPVASAKPPSSTAATTQAKAALAPTMFTIACTEVQVWNPWGVGADEELHLLTANIVFPTDSEEARTAIRSKGKAPTKAAADKSSSGPVVAVNPSAGIKNLNTTDVPEISDCSSAFKAAVQITYWGHGKIKLSWYLDETLIESLEVQNELAPVSTADGEAGKKPYFATMTSALPAVLQAAPHKLQVRVDRVKPIPPIMVVLGPSQSSRSQVNQKVSLSSPPKAITTPSPITFKGATPEKSTPTFQIIAVKPEPGSQVDSDSRFYKVFDHKTKSIPCALRYATLNTGTFQITDLSSFNKVGDTYSGAGMLNLFFPSMDGSVNSLQPLKVNFTGLSLAPTSDEDEDVLDVKSGTITQTYASDGSLMALNFPVKVAKVALTPEKLAIDGDVRLQSGMGFTNATVDDLPRWDFTASPLTSDGDFFVSKAKDVETELGASQFKLKISNADIDFSKSQGSAPVQPCGSPASGAEWRGIRIKGTMTAPDTLEFAGKKLLKDYTFDGWGIGPSGLSTKFEDPDYTKSVSTSGVLVAIKGFKFSVCNGSFGSPSFGVDVTNAPLVVKKISGTITLDEFSEPHSSFAGINVTQNWGTVSGKITNAALGYSAIIGNFALTLQSHFAFQVKGKKAYEHDYDGVLVTLDGNVFAPNGDHYWSAADIGAAKIGGYPMQPTALGVGNMPNGDVWFGFKGDVEVGQFAPNATNREAQFKLKKTTSASLTPRPQYQVASLTLDEATTLYEEEQDFDYSSSEKDGVTISEVHLDFSFPPSSKTVTVVADCVWEDSDKGFRFVGTGKVTVAESFAIDIDALYGRADEQSYWMVKASLTLPSMIPLGSTGFGLNEIHGGLGLSVPISAYDLANIKDVVTDKSGNYSFSAGVGLGTLDNGFTIYCKGTLTVKMGGPDAGARVSVDLWMLNGGHAPPPLAQACIQYAGGAFDAGMAFHLEIGGGLIKIEAPTSGPDVCTQSAIQVHFGGSGDWHIWIGHPPLPLTATILIIEGKGYLTIDGSGIAMYNGVTVDKKWDVDIAGFDAYLKIKGGVEIEGGIKYSPFFIHGSWHGYIDVWAGVDIAFGCCDVHFMIDLKFTGEAPPIKVCGTVEVVIGVPWPADDIDVTVGPLCIGG
jgi:hypothetical protein